MEKILNPTTGRFILYGGATHRKLMREGKMEGKIVIKVKESPKRVQKKKLRRSKKMPVPKRLPNKREYEEYYSDDEDTYDSEETLDPEYTETYSSDESSSEEYVPIKKSAKIKRTPEQQKIINERMAKMRAMRRTNQK